MANECIRTSSFPDLMKCAEVTPIYRLIIGLYAYCLVCQKILKDCSWINLLNTLILYFRLSCQVFVKNIVKY